MNITEFAAYAGVSKAAVSRFFNGGYLSAEKKAAIAKAVEETGYRPSMQAQMMRTRRTKQIGVILPKLSSESCARMVEGVSRVLDEQGYQLLLVNTANDNTREVRAMDMLRHDAVDGIILIASIFTPEHEAVLESLKIPVVILGQQHPGYSCVYHDDFGAARAATARMLEKGRRLPGFLGATMLDKAVGQARRAGYEAALRDAGLMPRAQRISVAKFNMESGYEQARQLFERAGEINALFCATDTIAIGAIQYCRSQGLRVPEDVMVASVGDSRAGRVAYVPLTSAHLHYRTAGDKAARLLLDQLFSNTAYTFLPILIAFSAAKVFGSNPFLGVVIGMIMIHPNLQNAWTVASEGVQTYQPVFGGLYSIPLVGYQGHVIPVIIAVGLMSQIEKRLHKVA